MSLTRKQLTLLRAICEAQDWLHLTANPALYQMFTLGLIDREWRVYPPGWYYRATDAGRKVLEAQP